MDAGPVLEIRSLRFSTLRCPSILAGLSRFEVSMSWIVPMERSGFMLTRLPTYLILYVMYIPQTVCRPRSHFAFISSTTPWHDKGNVRLRQEARWGNIERGIWTIGRTPSLEVRLQDGRFRWSTSLSSYFPASEWKWTAVRLRRNPGLALVPLWQSRHHNSRSDQA